MKKNLIPVAPTQALVSGEYQEKLNAMLQRGKSKNTLQQYQQSVRAFERAGFSIPATALQVATWLETATDEQGNLFKIATLEAYLSGIATVHRAMGFADPSRDMLVDATLKAIRRERSTRQKQARPLLLNDVLKMCMTKTDNLVMDKRDAALLLVGWCCALRRSEIAAIRFEDLVLTPLGYELNIQYSKTDQTGEGVILPIPYAVNGVCPVEALKAWLVELNQQGINEGYIFRATYKSQRISEKNEGLSTDHIERVIKNRARLARFPHDIVEQVTGHSLRAGFITQGAVDDLPEWLLQGVSRHKSADVLRRYIRASRLWKDSAAARMINKKR